MHLFVRGDARRIPFGDRQFDIVIGSPPYVDARLYIEDGKNLGISRKPAAWVEWMLWVTAESLRVSRGPVIWVAAGSTRSRTYQPAVEGLMWRWYSEGWGERGPGTYPLGSSYRPCYWKRVGIPGSGGDQWYRADVEYVCCFKRPGKLPYGDPKVNGRPPRHEPGGPMSHRDAAGHRKNARFRQDSEGRVKGGRARNILKAVTRRICGSDDRAEETYVAPAIANPGNLLSVKVGGGLMGHRLAHENEAPYPVGIPAFFVQSHCPSGGWVLDPFCGSGTTLQAAEENGRNGVGIDLRQSQCLLSRRRMGSVRPGFAWGPESPVTGGVEPNPSLRSPRQVRSMPGQMGLFR